MIFSKVTAPLVTAEEWRCDMEAIALKLLQQGPCVWANIRRIVLRSKTRKKVEYVHWLWNLARQNNLL